MALNPSLYIPGNCTAGQYGLAAAGAPLTLARLPLYLWATALSWWAMTVCTVLFSINEFWLTNSDLGLFFSNAFEIASSNPLDVYGRYFRQLLVWAIPVGVFTYVPACMLLGRIGPGMALAHSAWMLAAGEAKQAIWSAILPLGKV